MPNRLHQEEIKQFERLLLQQRMDRISDRMAVVKAFFSEDAHHDSEGWRRLIGEQGTDLEPDFVDHTLELLTKLGLATRRNFDGNPPRYEHQHLGEHHDHMICTSCGGITEFHDPELESLKAKCAKEMGFHHLSHRLQIYGLCKRCRKSRRPTMPLAMAAAGETVVVQELRGCDMSVTQLADMGITIGCSIKVISSNGGPIVVAVRGSRVALGRGVAHKIMVSPSD